MEAFKFINIDERAYKYIRQFTIKNACDALIEVITNSIDAYNKKGETIKKVDIEYHKPGKIVVRDYAIGLCGSDMEKCFLQVGSYTNVENSRGFFSRGAKDISAIGDIVFETIKDNKYTKILLNNDAYGKVEFFEIDATDIIRNSTKLLGNSNGLVVTINLLQNFITDPDQLGISIEKNAVLRDIMNDKNNMILYTIYNDKDKQLSSKRLKYIYPKGDILLDLEYSVPGYNDVLAKFVVYKLEEPAPQPQKEREMEFCFLIKSDKTIYEVDSIDSRFRWNPYIQYVRGYLYCNHIHELLIDYDKNGPTTVNPMPIIDPSRLSGVNKQHPFIISLLSIPKVRLDQILRELNRSISAKSIELNDIDNLFSEISKQGLEILNNEDIKFKFVPSYDAQLAKAIQNDRIKYVRAEKNYMYPNNNDVKQSLTNEVILQKIESLDSNPEENLYGFDVNDNIIQIPVDSGIFNNGELNVDILDRIPEDQISKLKENPYIYALDKGNLIKMYIFQKGRMERITEPENDAVTFNTKNFSIGFINDINLNKRYIVNYDYGINVKINIASESVKEYLVKNQNDEYLDGANNIISKSKSSVKSLVFLKELMLEIFTSIIIENDIINNKIILDSDNFNNSKKILDHRDNAAYKLESTMENIFKPYIIKNADTKMSTINSILSELVINVKSKINPSDLTSLKELKERLNNVIMQSIE